MHCYFIVIVFVSFLGFLVGYYLCYSGGFIVLVIDCLLFIYLSWYVVRRLGWVVLWWFVLDRLHDFMILLVCG